MRSLIGMNPIEKCVYSPPRAFQNQHGAWQYYNTALAQPIS